MQWGRVVAVMEADFHDRQLNATDLKCDNWDLAALSTQILLQKSAKTIVHSTRAPGTCVHRMPSVEWKRQKHRRGKNDNQIQKRCHRTKLSDTIFTEGSVEGGAVGYETAWPALQLP